MTDQTPDPFADAPVAATATATAETPAPDSSPEIPVVDREGAPVEVPAPDTPEVTAPADADAPIEEAPAESDAAAEYRERQERAQEIIDREQAAASPEAAQEPQEGAQEAESAPEAAVATPEAPTEPQTDTSGGGEQPPTDPAAPPATGEPGASAADAPTPDAPATGNGPGPRGGKGEMRQYKLLYQTGPAVWTEFELNPDHESVKVIDGEKWMMARNNEHAKRIGFYLLGAPKEGVTIFPVPKGAWKISRVKPAPPQPERERLVIE